MLYTLLGSERPRSFTSKKGVAYDVVDVQLKSTEPIPNGIGNYVLSMTVFSTSYPDFYNDIQNAFNTGNEKTLQGRKINIAYNQFGKVAGICFCESPKVI